MNFKDTGQDQQFKEIHQRICIEETHYSIRDVSGVMEKISYKFLQT